MLEGWLPERLHLSGLLSADEAERCSHLFPEATILPLATMPTIVQANGQSFPASYRITLTKSPGDKQVLYARAVCAALRDFIQWTQDSRHSPRVTGVDGREALAVALQADALAHSR